jgi:hypothetical protein
VRHTQINRTINSLGTFALPSGAPILTYKDSVYADEATDACNPVMSVVPLDGNDVTKGMVAYLTLGVTM